jgi:class 3 adenylate cyclase
MWDHARSMPARTWIVPRPLRRFFKQAPELHPVTLRFVDPEMGRSFHEAYYLDNLPYIRLAHVLGIVVWAAFGLLARYLLEDGRGGTEDLVLRYGIAIPIVLASLAITYARWYPRVWQQVLVAVLLVNGMLWSSHRAVVPEASAEWAFAGLVLILAFNYVLSRVQFVYTAVIGVVLIAYHNLIAVTFAHDSTRDLIFVDFFLVGYAAIGMAGAYVIERFMRLLFLRERELDAERRRADELLANTLPSAIVRRLKERHAEPETTSIADALPQVSVLFADLEAFTEHAARIGPDELVAILDDVFIRFDALADRLGMEKIKTVGDAYMAVAGAPEPLEDNARAAAEMAIGIQATMAELRWPSGDPMRVRVGIATGPAVAGVIGRRKFAYDLWGDTVNRASRLEKYGTPGRTLVDEMTSELLDGGFALSETLVIDLKGRGPTVARFLLGHEDAETSERPLDAIGEPAGTERY